MRIIEFVGVPGCGKSTVCDCVVEKLRKDFKVYTYQEIARMVSTPKRQRLTTALLYLSPSYRMYKKLLEAYAREYDNVSSQAIQVLLALYGMSKVFQCLSPKGIVVLDEGFIQTLTSIPHLQPIRKNRALEALTSYINGKHSVYAVRCSADEKLTIKRLRTRNRKDRFNSIQDEHILCQTLRQKQKNLDAVIAYFPTLTQIVMEDGMDAVQQNAEEIYRAIRCSV